jgi:hypothetical protein
MDHQHAHFTEFIGDPIQTITLDSKFTEEKESGIHAGGNKTHSKENHHHADFYKGLGSVIRQYDAVVLFGPTNAKAELFNIISKDHLFEKIKIEVRETDKMSESQQHAFVKNYFSGEVSV